MTEVRYWQASIIRLFFTFLSCAIASSHLLATDPVQKRYKVESIGRLEGLNSSDISALYQDRDGYIWIGNKPGVSRFDGYGFKNYTVAADQFLGTIYGIAEDVNGVLWVGGTNGLFYFRNGKFHPSTISTQNIRVLKPGKKGEMWIGGLGFVPFSLSSRDLSQLLQEHEIRITPIVTIEEWELKIGSFRLWAIDVDPNGEVWFGLDNTYASFDGKELQIHWEDRSVIHKYEAIAAFGRDSVFWGSQETPAIFLKNGQISEVPQTTDAPYTYIITKTDSATYFLNPLQLLELKQGRWSILHTFDEFSTLYFKNMILDREGNFWIGGEGDLIKLTLNSFQLKTSAAIPGSLSRHSISGLSDGSVLIGCSGGQLIRFNGRSTYPILELNVPKTSIIGDIQEDKKGQIWYATSMGGLVRESNGRYQRYTTKEGLNDNGQYFLYENERGTLWSGGDGGINRIRYGPGGQIQFDNYIAAQAGKDPDFPVFVDLFETEDGSVGAISDKGLYRIEDKALALWSFNAFVTPQPIITAVEKDSEQLWFSTQGEGLLQCRINSAQGLEVIRQWTTEDGFLSNVILDIHIDKKGRIWVVSQGGICYLEFIESQTRIKCFDPVDGWVDEAGAQVRLHESQDSLLWAVTRTSILNFPLYDLPTNLVEPKAFLNEVLLLDGKEDLYQYSAQPEETQLLPKQLVLPHHKNFLEFRFSATSHTKTGKNRYQYRLEGLDQNWSKPTENRAAVYSGLRSGYYSFQVRAANNDGLWGDASNFSFQILPPIWWRWWSILLYVVGVAAAVYGLYSFQLSKNIALVENRRLKELDQVKSTLYTNFTHEFRTPLTVILGMTQQLRQEVKKVALPKLDAIQRNGRHLAELINQMLALSKLESGQMQLEPVQADIIAFLRYLSASFDSYAEQNTITLEFVTTHPQIITDYDPKVIQQIFSNLLSNALKFTPSGGHITIEVTEKDHFLQLKVKDSGEGIPIDHQAKIFDRFYQLNSSSTRKKEGTGIGLALVKEWVELMKGKIEVESEVGIGSTFTVVWPITRYAPFDDAVPFTSVSEKLSIIPPGNEVSKPSDLPLVLVVEDHADIVRYLQFALIHQYTCIHAENGLVGLEMAFEKIPDLILCDIMMPEMDGYEVCQRLKTDERTNHIPIIMLTAKVEAPDRITGLVKGADAYLTKPFLEEELLVRMQNLLELRRQLQKKYTRELIGSNRLPESANSTTEPFLQKVEALILGNLEQENFGPKELARALFLSRSQLHRKIKALTDKSTSIYIRLIRLREARKLLAIPHLTVSEIAYQVGFKSPVYFSQVYKETFNHNPSEGRVE